MDQKTFFLFLFLKAEGNYRIVVETLGDSGEKGFSFSFGLLPEAPDLADYDGRPGRRRSASKETFQLCCL